MATLEDSVTFQGDATKSACGRCDALSENAHDQLTSSSLPAL